LFERISISESVFTIFKKIRRFELDHRQTIA
jgi:hypothetical protein